MRGNEARSWTKPRECVVFGEVYTEMDSEGWTKPRECVVFGEVYTETDSEGWSRGQVKSG